MRRYYNLFSFRLQGDILTNIGLLSFGSPYFLPDGDSLIPEPEGVRGGRLVFSRGLYYNTAIPDVLQTDQEHEA